MLIVWGIHVYDVVMPANLRGKPGGVALRYSDIAIVFRKYWLWHINFALDSLQSMSPFTTEGANPLSILVEAFEYTARIIVN